MNSVENGSVLNSVLSADNSINIQNSADFISPRGNNFDVGTSTTFVSPVAAGAPQADESVRLNI